MHRACLLVSALLFGCSHGATPVPKKSGDALKVDPPQEVPPRAIGVHCSPDETFPKILPVPEASGAVEVERDGRPFLLVHSDSGQKGRALLLPLDATPQEGAPPETRTPEGRTPEALTLSLDLRAGDDLEGIAAVGERIFTITSSGAITTFAFKGHALVRSSEATRLGPPPAACATLADVNCGRDYEGLCLHEARHSSEDRACDGYVASRAEGALYCVHVEGDRLALVDRPPIKLALPKGSLSDCAFGDRKGPAKNTLVITTNVRNFSRSYVVDEKSASLTELDVPGVLNNEAIAIDHEGRLYLFMDSNGETSGAARFNCRGW